MSDFTYLADKTINEAVLYNVLVSEFENGVEQRRLKATQPKRTWSLLFSNRTNAEMAEVRDFFVSKLGILTSFTWTNPNDSVEYTVRFKDSSFNFERAGYDIFNFSVDFIEVL